MTAANTHPNRLHLCNQLATEASPYLAQHAANPVAWQPWCEDAFATARRFDVPVFLSIGYSTCHWCHVMAHESFENHDIARLLNDNFVCIKIDREERPDIDAVYMRFCQALTGSGGWPLTIIMTPDKTPFFAATYIPPHSRGGRAGLDELLPRCTDAWRTRRAALISSARDIMEEVSRRQTETGPEDSEADLPARAFAELESAFDTENGGFGRAPKFPTPHTVLFLLRYWKRTGSEAAREMATATLHGMRRGGIYDHVGFGFHRYSTDPFWFLPHFEKMLYDQALLLWAYTEAFQATGEEEFAATAREIAAFVLRDLRSPKGGFYCALDADDEGGEGAWYQWTHEELTALLDPAELRMVESICGATRQGNARDEATGHTTGTNILHLRESLIDYARRNGLSQKQGARLFESLRCRLFDARLKRPAPARDEKILTDWNALMFGSLSLAGRVLGEQHFVTEAKCAADFILEHHCLPGIGLLHCRGTREISAQCEDYSFMIWGLMELYQAVFEEQYLLTAIALQDELCARYSDDTTGAFFSTHAEADDLPMRVLEIHDGAIPSGNSIAVLNLLRLAAVTGRQDYQDRAQRICRSFSGRISRTPGSCCMLMCALEYTAGPRTAITIAGSREAKDTCALLHAVNSRYLPDVCILLHAQDNSSSCLAAHMPGAALKKSVNNTAAAHVCKSAVCCAPICDAHELKRLLGS
jgi:uncharacterized protein